MSREEFGFMVLGAWVFGLWLSIRFMIGAHKDDDDEE